MLCEKCKAEIEKAIEEVKEDVKEHADVDTEQQVLWMLNRFKNRLGYFDDK